MVQDFVLGPYDCHCFQIECACHPPARIGFKVEMSGPCLTRVSNLGSFELVWEDLEGSEMKGRFQQVFLDLVHLSPLSL